MKLVLPLALVDRIVEHLKFEEIDTLMPSVLTENYNLSLNFIQKSCHITPSFKSPVEEDLIFGELLLTI